MDTVKTHIQSCGDCLLSQKYVNNKTLMQIRCSKCNQTYEQTYDRFKKGHQHSYCPVLTKSKNPVLSIYTNKNCKVCGTKFSVIRSARMTCSKKCQEIYDIDKSPIQVNHRHNYICNLYTENVRNFRMKCKKDENCEFCGEKDSNLLEFAHFDRSNKKYSLRDKCSIETYKKELTKGRFLCVWCHRLETRKEMDDIKQENLIKWIEDSDKDLNTNDDIKCNGSICKGLFRPIEAFYIRKGSGKSRKTCKRCRAYESRQKREQGKMFVSDKKLEIGFCEKCKIKVTKKTTCCFDFDHIDPFFKEYSISSMYNKSNEDIIREMKKCRLLCCKCHRLHTTDQFDYVNYNRYDYDENIKTIKKNYIKNTIKPPTLNIIKIK